jgi:hypothetical protein
LYSIRHSRSCNLSTDSRVSLELLDHGALPVLDANIRGGWSSGGKKMFVMRFL